METFIYIVATITVLIALKVAYLFGKKQCEVVYKYSHPKIYRYNIVVDKKSGKTKKKVKK